MDNETRRMEGLGWPDMPNEDTRPLDGQPSDARLRCLRCGGLMAETRAWARRSNSATRPASVELARRNSKPALFGGDLDTVSCYATTCTHCGWTEFYAEDMMRLRSLLQGEG